ncbi:MAG: hypothetical protein J2P48_05260 [Alphaproteobacteria bacterium]|nr:hypothetical protein [Alphaproteobacteria bacterium]
MYQEFRASSAQPCAIEHYTNILIDAIACDDAPLIPMAESKGLARRNSGHHPSLEISDRDDSIIHLGASFVDPLELVRHPQFPKLAPCHLSTWP